MLTQMQFEDIEEAAIWWDGVQVNPIDKVNMVSFQQLPGARPTAVTKVTYLMLMDAFQGRNNAIKLLKLDLPLMGPEAVMDGLTRQV